jgi:hypothetical protein
MILRTPYEPCAHLKDSTEVYRVPSVYPVWCLQSLERSHSVVRELTVRSSEPGLHHRDIDLVCSFHGGVE